MAKPLDHRHEQSTRYAGAAAAPGQFASLLTAPGRGALATVQIVSPNALDLVAACCGSTTGRARRQLQDNRLWLTRWRLEPVVIYAPTAGMVEVTCHGGPVSIDTILGDLRARGIATVPWQTAARAEAPGAIQAEAAEALAHASTLRTAAILLDQYHGSLDREIARLRHLAEQGACDELRQGLDLLIARSQCGLHLVEPWRVVLVGRPNTGKSSLLNRLVGFPRAIAHETPGTTRDLVTARAAVDGWPVEFCDTAGVRQPSDEIEAVGVERARQAIAGSDCQIVVLDRSRPISDADREVVALCPQPVLVANKADLAAAWDSATVRRIEPGRHLEKESMQPFVTLSALHGTGVDQLLAQLASRLVPDPPVSGVAVLFTQRQVRLAASARHRVERGSGEEALRELSELSD